MQRRTIALTFSLGLVFLFVSSTSVAQYQLTNLVSNQVGVAPHTDPLLVNAWGLVHGPGTPWWVSDNASGWSTLYNAAGVRLAQPLLEIPTAGGARVGLPTGSAFNRPQESQVPGFPSIFLLATLYRPFTHPTP